MIYKWRKWELLDLIAQCVGGIFTAIVIPCWIFASLFSACNGANGQNQEVDPTIIVVGQPCPGVAKAVLISRTKWDGATVDEWQFVSSARYYRVQVVADTVTYLSSTKEEF